MAIIRNRFTKKIMFEDETLSLRELVIKHKHDLSEADLRRADLSKANFSEADLYGANFSGADLSRADFRGAYLNGAFFSGADLSKTDFRRADLSGTDFTGVDLMGADLSGADLSYTNVSTFSLGNHSGFVHSSCVQVGCKNFHPEEINREMLKDLGEENRYTKEEIELYTDIILKLIKEIK